MLPVCKHSTQCNSNVKIWSFIFWMGVSSVTSLVWYMMSQSPGEAEGQSPSQAAWSPPENIKHINYHQSAPWECMSCESLLYETKDILIICNKQQHRTHVGSNHCLVYISHILWQISYFYNLLVFCLQTDALKTCGYTYDRLHLIISNLIHWRFSKCEIWFIGQGTWHHACT